MKGFKKKNGCLKFKTRTKDMGLTSIISLALYLTGYLLVDADTSNEISNLRSEFKLLEAKYNRLAARINLRSSYCSLQAQGKCGTCICKDDFTLTKKYYCDCRNQEPQRDCLGHYRNGMKIDGYYEVKMNGYRTTQVYCDQTTSGGGWTVIQRRMDGSVNFYRKWNAYKVGFGKLHREFWFGNDNIHILTAQAVLPKGSELLIQLKFEGHSNTLYNQYYSHVQVDSERSNYLIHLSGGSGGYASLFASYLNNIEFSTYDRDNDGSSSYNCALDYQFSGWWLNGAGNTCTNISRNFNLNGPYDKYRIRNWYSRMSWDTSSSSRKPTFSEIKIRRL